MPPARVSRALQPHCPAPPARPLAQELPALYSPTGQLLRQPTTRELQALRMRILELPSGHPVRAHLTQCQEFYTSGGCRDLLFHPCQTLFTLKDWQRMLRDAGLTCVGVFFPNLQVDVENRCVPALLSPSLLKGVWGGAVGGSFELPRCYGP